MKNKIIIDNFSVLEHIEIDVKNINILIGPQASGKSLIAKLVYFFRTIGANMSNAILSGGGKRELNNEIRDVFNLIFPDYIMKEAPFQVEYYYHDKESFIKLSKEKSKSYKSIKIEYSKNILNEFEKMKRLYKTNTQNKNSTIQDQMSNVSRYVMDGFQELINGSKQSYSVFIPAGRSFFANIEKNIFALIGRSFNIDYSLTRFGEFLQNLIRESYLRDNPSNYLDRVIYKMCVELLRGEYVYDSQKQLEYLRTKENKIISLRDSSSGQQEVAPLVISLMVLAKYFKNSFFMFVEEPETHLFPASQRTIVEIFAAIYNLFKKNTGYFITTHSPYILTAFNNLLQAENTYRTIMEKFTANKIDAEKKDEQLKALDKIVSANKRISFDDVSVHLVKNGKAKNIANRENRLIDANDIDEESNRMASIFDSLLDISFGES
ncbi:MAG: ATP-binding protein [Candidatus Aminicenantes bacterium]|nr:ATP-binding protein [Candidatus Aminicenantes bacterium]